MVHRKVDVFISGAGPVGLVAAYQLARLGNSVYIVDAANKASPDFPMYGRASTLMPRTLEMLDQIDLYDDLAQIGLGSRRHFTYLDGKRIQGRGWSIFGSSRGQTYFDFAMNIRLKYSEDVFREKLAELGVEIHAPAKLVDFSLDANIGDDYKVHVKTTNADGETVEVDAKYIIGSDGGGSTVRKLANIPFNGERKVTHWVRIDGIVKTNVPEARVGFGAFESHTHGQVLWVSLEKRATRIGYVLSDELFKKYGTKMSAQDAAAEAKKAVAPFDLEFEEIQWHTVYGIQQHVAERFQDRERILLCGDAAHTHSSGTAQGMNTGMHDVVNLCWRLSGVLKGLYKPSVLANYSVERKGVAEQLIDNDRVVSALISGVVPERFKGREENTSNLLYKHLQDTAPFTLGLGISYPANLLNDVQNSYPPLSILPGERAPDVFVYKPHNTKHPVRLYELAKNNGKFKIVIFAGQQPDTATPLKTLRADVDKESPRFKHAVDFLTIVGGFALSFNEYLPVQVFGKAYWDTDQEAHDRYNVAPGVGAIVVLRPDGILGFVAPLDGFGKVVEYLSRLVIAREPALASNGMNGQATRKELGEFLSQNESTLSMLLENGSKEEGLAPR